MSRVPVLQDLYALWAEGDFRAPADLYEEHFMLVIHSPIPHDGVYVGSEGVRGYMSGFLSAWERLRIAAESYDEQGDTVVVAVSQTGAGVGSGIETEGRFEHIWTFRGDQAIRMDSRLAVAD